MSSHEMQLHHQNQDDRQESADYDRRGILTGSGFACLRLQDGRFVNTSPAST